MRTELYPVPGPWPGRLAMMPRPRGGDWLEDEARAWGDAGVSVVVSLLTPSEISDLELSGEERVARANHVRFVSFPVEDREVPASPSDFAGLIASLGEVLDSGGCVAVHCRQGVGRAGLVALALLIRAGIRPEDAVRQASAARGRPVPETAEQRAWIERFALTPAGTA